MKDPTKNLQTLIDYEDFYSPLAHVRLHELRNANVVININPDGRMKIRVEQVVFHFDK